MSESSSIAFSAHIMKPSRATDISFENGDKISVFASVNGEIREENYAQNVCYEYYDNLFTTNGILSYQNDSTLTFYAIYPFGDYSTPSFTFKTETDQSSHEKYSASDLMTATATSNNEKVVDLTFNHRLSKVILNFSAEVMPAGVQSVTFKNVKNTVIADLSKNTFKYSESQTDIIACPNGTNSFKAILPPQVIENGSLFAEIRIGDKTYSWELDRDIILNSGVEYTFSLVLKDNVTFTSQINPWNTQEEIVSIIPEEYLELISPYIPIYEGTTPPNVEGVYLITPNILVTDNVGYTPGHGFADDYVMLYNQTLDNKINIKSTQLLGDLETGEGVFISGEGNNFTIYYDGYTTYDNGSWLTTATVISGTITENGISNYNHAFIVLDAYDTVDQYMDPGQYRILCDGDYISTPTEWPLESRSTTKAKGKSKFEK